MTLLASNLRELAEAGRAFTYSTFPRGDYDTIGATTPEWHTWYTRTYNIIISAFKPESPQAKLAVSGARAASTILGNGSDYFNNAKKLLATALAEAIRATEDDQYGELAGNSASDTATFDPRKVFIVHGHDEATKNELELFLSELGLEPVVLHRQADQGLTVLEKFEKHSAVGYALVILTPDDAVCNAEGSIIERRARQNVVFELGFFCGALGRNRVCYIYKQGTALPSDISGLIYKPFRGHVEEIKFALAKELRAAGYPVSL